MLDANFVVFHARIMEIEVLNSNLIHEVFTVKVDQHWIKCTYAQKLSNHMHYNLSLKERRISTWDWPESPHPGILCRVWQQTGHDDLKMGLGHLIQPVTDILEYRISISIHVQVCSNTRATKVFVHRIIFHLTDFIVSTYFILQPLQSISNIVWK